jgi:hypothetical protein
MQRMVHIWTHQVLSFKLEQASKNRIFLRFKIYLIMIFAEKTAFCGKNKAANISESGLEYGSSTWARTRDTRINSPLLYRLSYRGIGSTCEGVIILISWALVNAKLRMKVKFNKHFIF